MMTMTSRAVNAAAALLLAAAAASVQAEGLRPEVGKPLQQASDLLRAGKSREALAKVREADAVGGKTAAEQLAVERMRGAAAQRAGDSATAIAAFESLFSKVSGSEQGQLAEQLAFAYSQTKDWAKTSQWIQKAHALGSQSANLKQLQSYVQAQTGDYNAIARDAGAAVAAAEQAGRRPDEGDLLRLADAQSRMGNANGQTATLEKLLLNYPKKDYWGIYLARLPRKSGFSDRFSMDVLRLKLTAGAMSKAEDFMELAQLALQAGYPAEGKAVIDKGFASGALGKGAEAERQNRLRALAIKQEGESKAAIDKRAADAASAKDGTDLVQVGFALVSLGQADKGIALMEQGIAKGGLKRPEDAKLHLGMALTQSGKSRSKAVQMLRSVQGADGATDLARLWVILAGQAG